MEKKKKGNTDNLHVPTSDEARELGRLGGIASGVARKQRKNMRDTVIAFLESKGYDESDPDVDGYTKIIGALVEKAIKGDVSAILALRDTAGQKPADTLKLDDKRPDKLVVTFVDKSKPKKQQKDPKIVGESSPNVGDE